MIGKLRELFPEGTPIILKEKSTRGSGTFVAADVIGTVVDWRSDATGAWYARNGDPKTPSAGGKLQLLRLRLRKVNSKITDTIVDDLTSMAKLEAQ